MLDEVDLDRLSVKVKHQPFVYIVQGLFFFNKAKHECSCSLDDSDDLFTRAIHYFEMSLQSDPTNFTSLIHCAQSYYYLIRSSLKRQADSDTLEVNEEDFSSGEAYFHRAIQLNPSDESTCIFFAKFLSKCGLKERAEKIHLQGLQRNPFSVRCLTEYSRFLRKSGEIKMAEKFEFRAMEIENTLSIVFPKTRPGHLRLIL